MTAALEVAVEDRLRASPLLTHPDRRVTALTGGLTNQNFAVTVPAGTFVARLAGQSSALLAIDRDAEYHNCRAAAATGIAPEVMDFQPTAGVLVVRFVEGRTLTEADLRSDLMIRRVAAACRTLHSAEAFVAEFDMFALQRRYLDTCLGLGLRVPDGYADFLPQVAELRAALSSTPARKVPCHNDLLAANLIDDGIRLWIIDFEYSGNNDPCFELGNIASESHLPDDALAELVDTYAGRHDRKLIARTQLQQLMSQYGWTLWGVIQQHASTLDVDFWGWAMDRYERAASTFSSRRYHTLLRVASASDP